jgi:small subunit ribosomal protein S20
MISRTRPATRESAVAAAKIAVFTDTRRRWLSSVAVKGRYSTAPLMANIHSQKKRIERALRERDENRRYTSRIKTYFYRLETAVAEGDDTAADAEHRVLVQTIDKAVKRGSLHKNNGARKKSRAARVRRGAPAE